MAEHLLDCKITKVYKGPDGKNDYGPWQVYNLYLDKGDKKKFGYMHSGKKPIPVEDMQIKHVEYEIEKTEKDGKTYENYKIKKMELEEDKPESDPKHTPSPSQSNGNKDVSFYVSYSKDLQIALIQANPKKYEKADLDALAKIVVNIGLMMTDMVTQNPSEEPQDAPESQNPEESIPEYPELTDTEKKETRAQFKKYAKKDSKKYFETIKAHGAENAEVILSYPPEARQAVLDDLFKAIEGDIPF